MRAISSDMKLTTVDKLPDSRSNYYTTTVNGFKDSGAQFAKVEAADVQLRAAYTGLSAAAKRIGGVKVHTRNGELYLSRETAKSKK